MEREAERTLYSLSREYQRSISDLSYEVLAVDSGSSRPLREDAVRAFGAEFHHRVFDAEMPSPCPALNWGVAQARAPWVLVCIDGARMLSPGILSLCLGTRGLSSHPFAYTAGLHLGGSAQNDLLADGYDQTREDALLASVDWRRNGYDLFSISGRDPSTLGGFFAPQSESNCFFMSTQDYLRLGGYDEAFASRGGGLANLDIFNRVHADPILQPVKLLGEATFHQFHGGVSTNVPWSEHPWNAMAQEYEEIRGVPYETCEQDPLYIGWHREECAEAYGDAAPIPRAKVRRGPLASLRRWVRSRAD
jgi:hypothetical protein